MDWSRVGQPGDRCWCRDQVEKAVEKQQDEPRVRVDEVKATHKDGSTSYLEIRELTRSESEGKQTRVLTTHRDPGPHEVLWFLLSRWGRESFFKHRRQELAIDGLVVHGWLDVDPGLEPGARSPDQGDQEPRGRCQSLDRERQQPASLFKTAVDHFETELRRTIAQHYARTEDEGRRLILAAPCSSADLEVTPTEPRLRCPVLTTPKPGRR